MPEHRSEADYHTERAVAELAAGLSAACIPSARAHLRLSTMHMERARDLDAPPLKPPFIH